MDQSLNACPFLGMADDPDTLMAFASEWNCCHYAYPPVVVQFRHQQGFCLCSKFTDCPVFLRERQDMPLPLALRAPRWLKKRTGALG